LVAAAEQLVSLRESAATPLFSEGKKRVFSVFGFFPLFFFSKGTPAFPLFSVEVVL